VSARRRRLAIAGVVLLGMSMLGSLILIGAALQNSQRFDALFTYLLLTNGAGLLGFALLLVANVRELVMQLRARQPGARLTLRMVVIFVALSVLPLLVLYAFSLDFLKRGVDSWFDARIDRALEDALELSRNALDLRTRELLAQTETLAGELTRGPRRDSMLDLSAFSISALHEPDGTVAADPWDADNAGLDTLRQRVKAEELTIVSGDGGLIETSTAGSELVPSLPTAAMLLQLRQGRSYIGLDPLDGGGLLVRVAVNIPDAGVSATRRILHAIYALSPRINTLTANVEHAYARYNELDYLREKLRLSLVLTLTLVLLSSIAVATWAAFFSARRLSAPISALAAGTHAVTAGDYTTTLPVTSNDEIGMLVSSFNAMTGRIANARQEIESQSRYLNTLLSELSSGVLALDERQMITTLNDRGRAILGLDEALPRDTALASLADRAPTLRAWVEGLTSHLATDDARWQQEILLFGPEGRRTLMCRGSPLSGAGSPHGGHVIVFDDITALAKGQRDAAWSEVARRLAHEIKNPLTPIQLAAERLRQKYLGRMPATDAETLDRLTSTIIQQVDTLKAMVNTFTDYARPPVIHQAAVDVNALLGGVVDLYRTAHPEASFTLTLAPDLPPASMDATRFRQVFNNLMKNALEAHPSGVPARVAVTTRVVHDAGAQRLEIRIADAGEGIREDVLGSVFEPYVTNKTRGTGLGLAIVKKIVEEHGGMVSLLNNPDGGASALITLPLQVGSGEPGRNAS
jgi:nitrogen fixation/metabolism regulation signal transduction histidine kinase